MQILQDMAGELDMNSIGFRANLAQSSAQLSKLNLAVNQAIRDHGELHVVRQLSLVLVVGPILCKVAILERNLEGPPITVMFVCDLQRLLKVHLRRGKLTAEWQVTLSHAQTFR